MTSQIRQAKHQDVEGICNLLHSKMNSRIPVDRWRQLMSYRWLAEKPNFGWVVESSGKILGFCGQIYSDRLIGSEAAGFRQERMVSMSSWYLDKSLRGQGLGKEMLLASISDSSQTYMTVTNSKKPLGIVESVGFNILEDHRYLWHKGERAVSPVAISRDVSADRALLKSHQRQLVEDMKDMPIVPMMMEVSGEQVLLFFSIKRKGADVIWFDLLHSSDLALFAENAQAIANTLLPDEPSVLAADGRFVPEGLKEGAVREPLPVPRYFISSRVEPHEVDHLYSELQLLDLKLD